MGTFRMYTGADMRARVEKIDLEKHPEWLKGLAAKEISFRVWAAGEAFDWHPAPRRQFVIILSGGLEIGFEDGSKQRFGPGDARLVEDTTGRGHTTRVVGDEPCVMAAIALA